MSLRCNSSVKKFCFYKTNFLLFENEIEFNFMQVAFIYRNIAVI